MSDSPKRYFIKEIDHSSTFLIRYVNHSHMYLNITVSVDEPRVYSVNFIHILSYRYFNTKTNLLFKPGIYVLTHKEYFKIFKVRTSHNINKLAQNPYFKDNTGTIYYVLFAENGVLSILLSDEPISEPDVIKV